MKPKTRFILLFLLAGTIVYLSCQRELDCYDCKSNQPPIANAGSDTSIILPVNSIILDGSKSSDPDDGIESYEWKKISGPASFNITNPNVVQTQVTNLIHGTYQFELNVTDAGGLLSKDTIQVVVDKSSSNLPPVAVAGHSQVNALVVCNAQFDGSASYDPDGSIVAVQWTMISGLRPVVIADSNRMVCTVSGFTNGTYEFRLLVTDNMGLTDADTVQIKISNSLVGKEMIYNDKWGCNDICADGDVYWVGGDGYCDPNIPLEVSILLDTSSAWIEVRKEGSPPPDINQFYWHIDRGYLWVFAYEGKLIGRQLTIKAKFL